MPLLLALLLLCLAPLARAAAPLSICFEDVALPPWSTPDGGGLVFTLMQRVESELGEHFKFTAMPWKRCLQELKAGHVDAVLAGAASDERRSFAAFPTLAGGKEDGALSLYEDRVQVFLRVGSGASWDGRTLVVPDHTVGAPPGYLITGLLRARGYQVRELSKVPADSLRMLADGMVDAAVLAITDGARLIALDARLRGRVAIAAVPYFAVPVYLMVAKTTRAREPRRIEAIWRAIGAVRHSASYRKLEEAAGIKP
ncbi:MAG: transporter substrate-binding domain-containing protein [Pseudomonadota bacterium]